jgi:hypothetical protein
MATPPTNASKYNTKGMQFKDVHQSCLLKHIFIYVLNTKPRFLSAMSEVTTKLTLRIGQLLVQCSWHKQYDIETGIKTCNEINSYKNNNMITTNTAAKANKICQTTSEDVFQL